MIKLKQIGLAFIILSLMALCVWATVTGSHDPWDGTLWDVTAPIEDIAYGYADKELRDLRKGVALRVNKEHETLATSSAGGVHKQGSARAFFQDATPSTQVDGSAFDSGDLGSLWFDSNAAIDNQFHVLTATTPTWTPVSTEIIAFLLASNRTFAGTLTVTGLLTANSGVTLGAGDDLIGSSTSDITFNTNKFTVAGATGNTGVGGTLDVTGNIDPTTFETTNGGFLDEDNMASDAANKVSSQQSIKKYVDDNIGSANWTPTSLSFSSNAAEQSITYPNGLIFKAGYVAKGGDPTTITFGTAFPNAILSANIMQVHTTTVTNNSSLRSGTTSAIIINDSDQAGTGYYWQAWGR